MEGHRELWGGGFLPLRFFVSLINLVLSVKAGIYMILNLCYYVAMLYFLDRLSKHNAQLLYNQTTFYVHIHTGVYIIQIMLHLSLIKIFRCSILSLSGHIVPPAVFFVKIGKMSGKYNLAIVDR